MPDRLNLRVLVFPADDLPLRGEVERALQDLSRGDITASDLTPETLETRLRPWYRSVQVRIRDPLGGYADEPTVVWYVYRDGRIRRRNEPLDGLYSALADARSTTRMSEHVIAEVTSTIRREGFVVEPGPDPAEVSEDRDPPPPAAGPVLEPVGGAVRDRRPDADQSS